MKAARSEQVSESSARVAMVVCYLTEDLALSVNEMRNLRGQLDEWLARNAPASTPRRTLYLPSDPLDDL